MQGANVRPSGGRTTGPGWHAAARRRLRALVLIAGLATGALLAPGLGVLAGGAALAQARMPATLTADSVFVDSLGRLIATGSVEVWHGSVRLSARRVAYDPRRGTLDVEGPIVLSDGPDRVILADAAQIDANLRSGLIQSARMVLDRQFQIAAASIERPDSNITRMNAVVASSCRVCAENPTPLWEIRAARVTHDRDAQQLYFERAQFRVHGVPLFYAPRLRLPDPSLTRARGFLVPRWSARSRLGFGVSLPYFIPLGPAHDLTLTPTITSRGAYAVALRYRAAFVRGGLELGGQIARDRDLPGQTRGHGYLRALFLTPGDFRLSADLLVPSDRDYLDTYGITSDRRITSHVTLDRYRRDQAIRARAVAFRTLEAGVDNRTLPNQLLQAEWEERLGLGAGGRGGDVVLRFGGHAHQRRSRVDGDSGRDLARFFAQARWQRQTVLPGGILATGVVQGRVDHLRITDDSRFAGPITRHAVEGMAELRWPWAAADGRGGGHVIEPIAQIIASRGNHPLLPNDDNLLPELDPGNLFALPRYSGHDARDDGPRANLGLRWSRHDPTGWTVETLVGRILRRGGYPAFDPLNPQPLGQTRSHWLLAGQISSAQGAAFGLRLLLDDNRRLSRGETSLRWVAGATGLATSYVYLPANTFEGRPANRAEWHFDLSHRFDSGWAGRFGWEYDAALGELRTARTGLEFRNECIQVDVSLSHRFATSTNVRRSTSFGLQIDLLGIGGGRATPTGRSCRT
ncbi:MAG: LPS-assembly protein LptD [Pararhodobacter sp.]